VAKYQLLSDGMVYKGTFYTRGDVIDFGDEVDVKGLEASSHIGVPGTLEKLEKAAEKIEEDHAKWESERSERDMEFNRARYEAREKLAESRTTPNVSSQDGPQVTRPSGRPGNRRR
jgi:hypothetical protein